VVVQLSVTVKEYKYKDSKGRKMDLDGRGSVVYEMNSYNKQLQQREAKRLAKKARTTRQELQERESIILFHLKFKRGRTKKKKNSSFQ